MLISSAYAQTAPAATPASGDLSSSLMSMLPLLLMFVVLYFVMIRPQMKRQKEQKTMLEALSRGDEVVVAGVLGKIVDLDDNHAKLEVAKGVIIQVQRGAIGTLLPKGTIQ